MYHAVCSPPSERLGPWKYAVSPSKLEGQIKRIKSNYEVVSLDEVMNRADTSEDLAVLTFDDGYKNNLTNGVPILEKHDVPATIYVSTSFVNGKMPYEYIVADTLLTSDSIQISLGGSEVSGTLNTVSSRERTFEKIKKLAKTSPEVRREIFEKFPSESSRISMLTPEDLKQLDSNSLITIGAHGHRHLPLTSVSNSALEQEVRECKAVLEEILGHDISHFSYPYGSNNAKVREKVRESGYETAVTTNPSYIGTTSLKEEKYSLPRFDASITGVK